MPAFDTLKYLMDHHIRLQLYAETKNGVLLGLCAASLAPITALLGQQVENGKCFQLEWWAAAAAFLLIFLSAFVLLLSFHTVTSPEVEPEQSCPFRLPYPSLGSGCHGLFYVMNVAYFFFNSCSDSLSGQSDML